MVIYTKRGDKGETSTFDPDNAQRTRISKDSLIVETLGAIDELDSFLGIAKVSSTDKKLQKLLDEIQRNLLTIGSITGGSSLRFSSLQTKKLEKIIDGLEGSLPVLKNFVVPGGSAVAAGLQYARALARRAERRMVALYNSEEVSAKGRSSFGRKPQILEYLNRLSDVLFMLAREANRNAGFSDDVWIGKKR